jgi:hypothetical protein
MGPIRHLCFTLAWELQPDQTPITQHWVEVPIDALPLSPTLSCRMQVEEGPLE